MKGLQVVFHEVFTVAISIMSTFWFQFMECWYHCFRIVLHCDPKKHQNVFVISSTKLDRSW